MPDIPSVTLNNGVAMPQLGLGVWTIPNDQVVKNVVTAIENGYRLIDTATRYENEAGVGEGIRASGIPREEIFVASKLSYDDSGYDSTLKGFNTSLEKLGLDYIDLYLIHFPVGKELTIETWKALEHVYKEGRARAIGVCNFKTGHLDTLLRECEVVPAIDQIELHPTFTQEDIRQYAKEHRIQVEAWSPLGGVRRSARPAARRTARSCWTCRCWPSWPGSTAKRRLRLYCAGILNSVRS